jgi:hypothetical protein
MWMTSNLVMLIQRSMTNFCKWLEEKYRDLTINFVKATRGKLHDYLAINLDYQIPGLVRINKVNYVKAMVDEFPDKLGLSNCPWNGNLFKFDQANPALSKEKSEQFHTFVAKGLFL